MMHFGMLPCCRDATKLLSDLCKCGRAPFSDRPIGSRRSDTLCVRAVAHRTPICVQCPAPLHLRALPAQQPRATQSSSKKRKKNNKPRLKQRQSKECNYAVRLSYLSLRTIGFSPSLLHPLPHSLPLLGGLVRVPLAKASMHRRPLGRWW